MSDSNKSFNSDSESVTSDDFKVWKKNTPYLYNTCITHILEWPTLTSQFLPYFEEDNEFKRYKILMSAQSSTTELNSLIISKLKIPKFNEETKEFSINKNKLSNFLKFETKINFNSEINKARYMPQNYNIIAAIDSSKNLTLLDYASIPINNDINASKKGKIEIINGCDDNFALDFSKLEGGILATSKDSKLRVYDFNNYNDNSSNYIEFKNDGTINDVSFHCFHKDYILSGCEEGIALLCDKRSNTVGINLVASCNEIFSLDNSFINEYLFLVGDSIGDVKLFDLRYLKKDVNTYKYHNKGINRVSFNNYKENIFAAASADGKVSVWDISNYDNEDNNNDIQKELIFVHGGHRAGVSDFNWSMNTEWMAVSCEEENNAIQIWEMKDEYYYDN